MEPFLVGIFTIAVRKGRRLDEGFKDLVGDI